MSKPKGKKKIIIPILLLILIGGAIWYYVYGTNDDYHAEVEGEINTQISEVQGKIIEMDVTLGSQIKKGDIIAVIDKEDQEFAIKQLELSKDALEESPAADTDAGEIEIDKVNDQIKFEENRLKKFTVKAPCDGTVMSVNYKKGDMVSPGFEILSVSDDAEKYCVFYVPKEDIDKYSSGDEITMTSNDKDYVCIVTFIDVKSEYTPKDFQTTANKNKKSIKIKARLPKDCFVKPGSDATVKKIGHNLKY